MRRPILVLVPVLAFLLVVGSPFLRLQQGVPDATVYPAGVASRDAWVALQTEFRAGRDDADRDPRSTRRARRRARQSIAGRAGVRRTGSRRSTGIDRVEGPFAITDPATGAPMTAAQVAQLYAAPPGSLPPELEAGLARLREAYIRGNTVRLDAISPLRSSEPAGTAVISRVRAVAARRRRSPSMQVGGAAALGEDFLLSQSERIPWADRDDPARVRDHPVPAVRLARDPDQGRRHDAAVADRELRRPGLDLPGGQPPRAAELRAARLHDRRATRSSCSPSLIGLSMDYEVLLLSRIQESYRRTGDNTAAVADGLARTAGVITGAALIMVTVFAAFALADTVTIKSIGVGMALAVALDATIIRVLLVPATMRLLGRWNWWAPGPLGPARRAASGSATSRTRRILPRRPAAATITSQRSLPQRRLIRPGHPQPKEEVTHGHLGPRTGTDEEHGPAAIGARPRLRLGVGPRGGSAAAAAVDRRSSSSSTARCSSSSGWRRST